MGTVKKLFKISKAVAKVQTQEMWPAHNHPRDTRLQLHQEKRNHLMTNLTINDTQPIINPCLKNR